MYRLRVFCPHESKEHRPNETRAALPILQRRHDAPITINPTNQNH
jgi:hypothetical protein